VRVRVWGGGEGGGQVGGEGGGVGDVQAEGRLAHAGTTRDDHQVGALQTGGQAIEVGESRWHPGDGLPLLVQPVDGAEGVAEEPVDAHERGSHLAIGDGGDVLVGAVHQLLHVLPRLVAPSRDAGGGGDEAGQGRR